MSMLELLLILSIAISSIVLTSSPTKSIKPFYWGMLLVLGTGISTIILSSSDYGVMEKMTFVSASVLQLLAVPFILFYLIKEKSFPRFLSILIATALLMLANDLSPEDTVDHSFLVQVEEGLTKDVFESIEGDLHIEEVFFPKSTDLTDLDDYFLLEYHSIAKDQIAKKRKSLGRLKGVVYVEDNDVLSLVKPVGKNESLRLKSLNTFTNDPLVVEQWGMEAIRLREAYDLVNKLGIEPKRKAKVVVLDTGVKGDHEDLRDNVFEIDKKSLADKNGHGTHCAGTIAAGFNNGKGIVSFNFDNAFIEFSSIKVLGDSGRGTERRILNGIIKAVDAGADVISMSLGGLGSPAKHRTYQKAIEYAKANNVIIVSAAGNSDANAKKFLPTALDYVVSVSAIDSELNKASFSNRVDEVQFGIAAPGVQIISTDETGKYKRANGTSMAAPFVSGAMALLRSIDPELSVDKAYEILQESGKNTNDSYQTGKLIQMDSAIQLLYDQLNS